MSPHAVLPATGATPTGLDYADTQSGLQAPYYRPDRWAGSNRRAVGRGSDSYQSDEGVNMAGP